MRPPAFNFALFVLGLDYFMVVALRVRHRSAGDYSAPSLFHAVPLVVLLKRLLADRNHVRLNGQERGRL
jgi:hypothetical protein